ERPVPVRRGPAAREEARRRAARGGIVRAAGGADAAAHAGRDRRPAAPGGAGWNAAEAAGDGAPAQPDPPRPAGKRQDHAGQGHRGGERLFVPALQRRQRGRAAAARGGEGGRDAEEGRPAHAAVRGRDPSAEQGAAGLPSPVDRIGADDAGGRHDGAPGVRDQPRRPVALARAGAGAPERGRRTQRGPSRAGGRGAGAGRCGRDHRPRSRRRAGAPHGRRRAAGADGAGDRGAAGGDGRHRPGGRSRGAAAAHGTLRHLADVRDAVGVPQVAAGQHGKRRAVLGHADDPGGRGSQDGLPPPRRRRVRGRRAGGPAGGHRLRERHAGVRAPGRARGAAAAVQRHPVRGERAQVEPRVPGRRRRRAGRPRAPRRPHPAPPAQPHHVADEGVGLRRGLQVRPRLSRRLHAPADAAGRHRRPALLRAHGPRLRSQDRRPHARSRRPGV
ncbi:MAG: Replication-associated recombination protein RarA, partial [uncultured Gemmatimonadetes bacterium]